MSGRGDPLRTAIRFLIAVLCAAALLLIVLILSGSEVDETGGKAIRSAVAVAFYSLTAAAGASLSGRRPQLAGFGYTTALISALALVAILCAFWTGGSSEAEAKIAAIAFVLALGTGHASLMLAGVTAGDSDTMRNLRLGVLAALTLLCLLVTIEIASSGDGVGVQAIAVVAVLYVLGTILLPLVRRGAPQRRPAASLSAVELLLGHGFIPVQRPPFRADDRGAEQSVYLRGPGGQVVELIVYDDRP